MKHIPILFSTPMVQALLEGRKTQTRRVVKPQPRYDYKNEYWIIGAPKKSTADFAWAKDLQQSSVLMEQCPYGQPGDVLWVRESWRSMGFDTDKNSMLIQYKDESHQWVVMEEGYPLFAQKKWKPSIHMPKAACRLWLKVKATRVERLLTISGEDAVAEGVTTRLPDNGIAQNEFHELWKSIHGPEGLYSNPWVWVIEFERCAMPADFLTR